MAKAKEKLTPMRLIAGKFMTLELDDEGHRKFKKAGEIVQLTDKQLVSFANKFEDPSVNSKRVAEAKAEKAEKAQEFAEAKDLARKAAEEVALERTAEAAEVSAEGGSTEPAEEARA